MPVFAYSFESKNLKLPTKVELVGQGEQHIKEMRVFLMRQCIENTSENLSDSDLAADDRTDDRFDLITALEEDLKLFREVEPDNLPIDTPELIEHGEVEGCTVTDKATGVMISRDPEGEFYPLGDELIPDSLSHLTSELSSDEAILQAIKGEFNYHAYAVEPRPDTSRDQKYTVHTSLGYLDPESKMLTGYTPVVTVLGESHPVRQLIENPPAVSQA